MYEAALPLSPQVCFNRFIDLEEAKLWLPGLKKLKVARHDARGRPLEVSYEFGERLSYALVYAYDDAALRVRWVPSVGLRDGVSGQASFTANDGGCLFRYSIESLRGRAPTHEQDVGEAFTHWLSRGR